MSGQMGSPRRTPTVSERAELDRIRSAYASRARRRRGHLYDAHRPETLLHLHQAERLLLTGLGARGFTELGRLEILDVGSGYGEMLLRLVSHGADPEGAHGIDLLEHKVLHARSALASADLRVGNAGELPWPDDSMDLVLQSTMLSSVLDAALRGRIASEMVRVLRPTGVIVSHDFWFNPVNHDVRGVTRRELRALFPGHRVEARSVTLAPPIARALASRSYGAAALLQTLAPLCTHVLAFITPKARSVAARP
jgi:SAM-dependent methyltransferase